MPERSCAKTVQLIAGERPGCVVTVPTPAEVGLLVTLMVLNAVTKCAVAVRFEFIVKTHGCPTVALAHASAHACCTLPAAGLAVSVTTVPAAKSALHEPVFPESCTTQLMP